MSEKFNEKPHLLVQWDVDQKQLTLQLQKY